MAEKTIYPDMIFPPAASACLVLKRAFKYVRLDPAAKAEQRAPSQAKREVPRANKKALPPHRQEPLGTPALGMTRLGVTSGNGKPETGNRLRVQHGFTRAIHRT